MQVIITHGTLARSRVLHFNRWQLVASLAGLTLGMLLIAATLYHLFLVKAARESWPLGSQLVQLLVRDEFAQRDRFMRENLDAMAQRVGEMQAKLVKLEAMSERVSGMAGVKAEDLKPVAKAAAGGQGGPYVPMQAPSLEGLNIAINALGDATDQHTDLFTYIESRLFEGRLQALMIPTSRPVEGSVGSGFGFRTDPFTGSPALHTGLDFPGDIGTPIQAAAGGVVLSTQYHGAYGHVLEIDHGNGLVTRYAHTSKIHVKAGDLVRRGQRIADVGTSGRSTGPHLHFEVLVEGVPQDPAKFLAGGPGIAEKLAHGRASRSRR
jgi:murein DD-endopeptidase MepM/ murein hydrolase activator NlpD